MFRDGAWFLPGSRGYLAMTMVVRWWVIRACVRDSMVRASECVGQVACRGVAALWKWKDHKFVSKVEHY